MSRTDEASIRVLHVDDEPDLVELASMHLEREREALTVITETSATDALARLDDTTVDCIVSDYDMPGMDGLAFLEAVRESHPDLPFILFTGKGSEEIASEAITAGVTDYIQKEVGTDQYTVLANRIERAVDATRAKDALAESERMLSTLISNLPGMVYRCRNEPGWPMEFVSDGCRSLTGYDAGRLESGAVDWGADVIHPEDQGTMWETVQAALDAGEPFEVTYRITTADGETRWMWEQGEGIYDDGDVTAIEGFITDITDRKAAQQRRQKYETVVESMDDGAFILDEDRTFEFVNEAFLDATGFESADVVGEDSDLFVTGTAPREEYEAALDRLERGESEKVRTEVELVAPGEGERTMNLRLTRLGDTEQFRGIVGVCRDVTERRERERELERYETLVENVGDPMYALDADGVITIANEAMAAHLGYAREELLGTHVSAYMAEEDVRTGNRIISELIDDEDRRMDSFEMETVCADGDRTQTEDKIAVLTDDDGTFAGSVGVIRDISERKARERELERYETIIQAVGDPVYTLDAEGNFTFVNDAIESLAGHEPDTLVGNHVSTLIRDSDVETARNLIQTLLESEDRANATFEMELVTRDGDHVPSENHMALLPFEDDEFRGTAGIVRDITERKQREQRLEQFASVVSHDLRNPLNVIQGRVEFARKTGDPAHLDTIQTAADRMERLIDDLLTLARQGQTVGDTEPVSVGAVAEDAWQQVDTDGATLELDGSVGTVSADRSRLRELFENLFRNSVEHGSTGNQNAERSGDGVEHGSTSSRTQSDDSVEHGSTADDDEPTVRVGPIEERDGGQPPNGFYVADDGSGIPPADREQVFEHGYTDSDDGTGFGLAIVQNIVDAHGWDIDVTESRNAGARFEITDLD